MATRTGRRTGRPSVSSNGSGPSPRVRIDRDLYKYVEEIAAMTGEPIPEAARRVIVAGVNALRSAAA